MRSQLELDNQAAAELAGAGDAVLRALRQHLDCDVFMRGNVLTLDGEPVAVEAAEAVVRELSELVAQGHELAPGTIEAVTRALYAHTSPAAILEDVVWRHRQTRVAPKTVNQKRYVDSIRRNTITFGIGPAGTGKTFLAVALAAAALSRREVNRIILTRPAVEAGERLGFLPGDMMAKVDPYLRPLFDALHDMLEADRVSQHLERGVIEVAPLAFMRGRAQPLSSRVLTPGGFRRIDLLEVGDLVIGSNGQPTPVIGVYPQGRRPVYRLSAQDGASALCCAEHLWHVYTAADRRRGGPGRVLQTQQMIGRLRRFHCHRFELPLLSAPAELARRAVPLEPYALGLLLGDGCMTSASSPTVAVCSPELAPALHRRPQVSGASTAALPTDVAPRLGLAGPGAHERFIPQVYLHNCAAVRMALLQGLLDAGGEPLTRTRPTGRIQYTTCSRALCDGVVDLVRSLGGVAHRQPTGVAAWRRGDGAAWQRHRDAHTIEIRLPSGLEPFRLARKRKLYDRQAGGHPIRFVESIEPAGEMECVCIQVAAADSLYVTDDFLLTHNTLNDSFIILDEAQNTSPEQMKMFLTRLGFNSKMVITGDITQIDLPREQGSGLVAVTEVLQGIDGIEFVRFGEEDVVRHKLVRRIVAAYDEHAQRSAPELRPRRRL